MIKKTNIFEPAGWRASSHGQKFQRGHLALTNMNDDNLLGCSAFSVEPGKRAFPKHGHLANDEALYIVSGSGTLTVGDESDAVTAGDFVMLPRGCRACTRAGEQRRGKSRLPVRIYNDNARSGPLS